jgi:hypothetical protein
VTVLGIFRPNPVRCGIKGDFSTDPFGGRDLRLSSKKPYIYPNVSQINTSIQILPTRPMDKVIVNAIMRLPHQVFAMAAGETPAPHRPKEPGILNGTRCASSSLPTKRWSFSEH